MCYKDKRKNKSIWSGLGFVIHCMYNPVTKHIGIYSQIRKLKSKKQIKKNNKNQINKAKIVMARLKENGCAICGYNKCESSLVFHHTNPTDKKRRIDYQTLRCNNNVIVNELNKCILLCAN